MEISVFTPSHQAANLESAYQSLRNQSLSEWEWIVWLNGEASKEELSEEMKQDSRVKIYEGGVFKGVGAAKADCIRRATGKYLLELDHDDLLMPEALQKTLAAFKKGYHFVYSNTLRMQADSSPELTRYGSEYGWEFRPFPHRGQIYLECISFPPTPQAMSFIWFMPNHLRAFSKELYLKAGGYDPKMEVNDDQDLMQRMYAINPQFHLINEALYLQRIHPEQTQVLRNQEIQVKNYELYWENIEALALSWSQKEGLGTLELGAPGSQQAKYSYPKGIPTESLHSLLEKGGKLPFADNSLGLIRATDILCRAADPVHLMNECYRVLTHGGMLLTSTPSTDGRGAFQDPGHRSFWNQNSFWYYTQAHFAKYLPRLKARFQLSHAETKFPNDFCRAHDISYVSANLSVIKSGERLPGLLEI